MLIYWLALAALVVVGLLALWRLHALRQMHHLYLGALLALFAVLPLWAQLAIAFLIVLDDVWQHAWQALSDPGYVSPLHRLYAWAVAQGMR